MIDDPGIELDELLGRGRVVDPVAAKKSVFVSIMRLFRVSFYSQLSRACRNDGDDAREEQGGLECDMHDDARDCGMIVGCDCWR